MSCRGCDLALEIAEGLARVAPRDRTRAPVLSLEELLAMAAAAWRRGAAGDLSGWQDLLLVNVGYAGGLRMDDLYRARVENLERLSYGYALRLGASKENPTGRRAESVLLLARSDGLDPVTAIDIWRARAGTDTGPLLAVVGSHPQVSLSKDSLPDRLRRIAIDARITTRPTGHSLRRSWATHAYERGVDPVTLSRHLRHRDLTTTLSYVANLSAWVDNAARELIDHHTRPDGNGAALEPAKDGSR